MKKILAAAGIGAALAAGGLVSPGSASASTFTMCPDGHEGVVGEHTSCGFAENIRSGYFHYGTHFNAYSPTTDQWYETSCDPRLKPAYFENGLTVSSVNCYASSNAEVVVW